MGDISRLIGQICAGIAGAGIVANIGMFIHLGIERIRDYRAGNELEAQRMKEYYSLQKTKPIGRTLYQIPYAEVPKRGTTDWWLDAHLYRHLKNRK